MYRQKVLAMALMASLASLVPMRTAAAQVPPLQQQSSSAASREQILASINPGLFNPKGVVPDINAIPALSNIVKAGGKLYYLGERSNLSGWLIVKNDQIQMIYLTPDHQTVIIGGLFTSEGQNVTGPQITYLSQTNRDIGDMINNATQQQNQVTSAGGVEGGVASVPGDSATTMAAVAGAPQGPGVGGLPTAVTLSPGERLYQDMEAAAGVELGPKDKPEIMIIVAPKCPNCKRTWKELRDSVKGGQVRVKLIPIYNSMGNEELNEAAQFLKTPAPLETWDRFVEGDTSALGGKPDEMAVRAVMANLNLISKWNIKGYPYLVYRGKNGRIKIVQGKPERMPAVLLDLSKS